MIKIKKKNTHSQAIDFLKQAAYFSEPYSDLNKDVVGIIQEIYNWSFHGGRFMKLYECGSSHNAMAFAKSAKDLMYEAGVLGSSQLWSAGRIFVDFWDTENSKFGLKLDQLHTRFEADKSYDFLNIDDRKAKKTVKVKAKDVFKHQDLPREQDQYNEKLDPTNPSHADLDNVKRNNPYFDSKYVNLKYMSPSQRIHKGTMITFTYLNQYGEEKTISSKVISPVKDDLGNGGFLVSSFAVDSYKNRMVIVDDYIVPEDDIVSIVVP